MAGGSAWSRRGAARARALRGLVRDTQRSLQDATDVLTIDPEVSTTVHKIGVQASNPAVLVILGNGREAQTRLLHALLGRRLLDPLPQRHIWVKIQYGSSTQVHLTLGNSEFELVEELESSKGAWETLPIEDLIRQDNMDPATILEIELNNQFLKDGLKIVIPPDLIPCNGINYQQLKELNADLYTKREQILKTFNPIYLYAVDKIGKNIFAENFCNMKVNSKSYDDFWSTYNLYYMTRSESEIGTKDEDLEGVNETDMFMEFSDRSSEPCVFNSENCLDLHQIKELNPNAQVFFFLLSDSEEISSEGLAGVEDQLSEATESTEDYRKEELPEADRNFENIRPKEVARTPKDAFRLYEEQCAFMNELLDQWELMSAPVPKHGVKSQWAIVDDLHILQVAEQKALGEKALAGTTKSFKGKEEGDRVVKSRSLLLSKIVKFATDTFQNYILDYCTQLSEVHVKLLQQFILASYDLARALQVVPARAQYAARHEAQLYQTIHEKFSRGDKQQELVLMLEGVLEEMKVEVQEMDWSVDDLPCHQDKRFQNSVYYDSSRIPESGVTITSLQQTTSKREQNSFEREQTSLEREQNASERELSPVLSEQDGSDVEEAVSYDSYNFDDYEIIDSNDESLIVSDCFRNSGTINVTEISSGSEWRASLVRVENERSDSFGEKCLNRTQMSVKQATLDVQKTVLARLSRKVRARLVTFVDCLKDSYFGTLKRCLDSLEAFCVEAAPAPPSAAVALLLGAALRVQLQPPAALPALHALRALVLRLLNSLRLSRGGAGGACCVLSPAWRRRAAADTVASLSAHRLARLISDQMLERVRSAHEQCQAALGALLAAAAPRLQRAEDNRRAIRKKYAPGFARLCLESTSICDLLKHGMPELGREIGRGQYGVVYAIRGSWGQRAPLCGKSVLPADDRHYCELAMELFYTRSIPEHPRVVPVVGSLVLRQAARPPSVLLLSPRYSRDLHAAVRAGLRAAARMDIAIDIVEGIRYLHSLGLVHRDIKMKNVLLDASNRAALADLGFCMAGALVSGSVVGTPVHMAPELLAGDYGADVDVYAFGILFWYLCAGSVKLPAAFEAFQNKEQLWNKVARGRRPERLDHFSDQCWDIMSSCWAAEPSARPLPGQLLRRLRAARGTLREGEGRQGAQDEGGSLVDTGIDF